MTGSPQAIASIRTIPNDSGGSVVSRRRSAPRSTPGSSACGTGPRKWTRSPTPAAVAWSRKAVEQLAASGDHQVHRPATAQRPRPAPSAAIRASASIARSSRLKWWARSRVATKAATSASSAIPSRSRRPRSVRPGREQLRVDAVWHLDQLLRATLAGPAKVRDRARVVARQHADPVRLADQKRRGRVLVGFEQGPARALADQPVLVVDQQRLAPAPSRQSPEQRQLGAEDERIVEVNDVEALDPSQARDQRRVADREAGLDPVDDGPTGVRRLARPPAR